MHFIWCLQDNAKSLQQEVEGCKVWLLLIIFTLSGELAATTCSTVGGVADGPGIFSAASVGVSVDVDGVGAERAELEGV